VKVLQIEPKATYRKYKEAAHMSLVDHLINQPSLDISPIWTPVITAEFRKLQLYPVQTEWESCVFILVLYGEFVFLVMTSLLILLIF
jgi:hypothetical protein